MVPELKESALSWEKMEKPELELDERELDRECRETAEMAEIGEEFWDRAGVGMLLKSLAVGVNHVGSRTSSAIMAKSSSSSSSSISCWA